MLMVMVDAYDKEELEGGDSRVVMHIKPALAPYKVAVLPLQKKLVDPANELLAKLSKEFMATTDVTGSIGKRYRRQDEIGTPYCVTVDFDTLTDHSVTVRDRDTMKQDRVSIDSLVEYLKAKIAE